MSADSHEHADDYHVHAHVSPVKTYMVIFGALIVLTLLTVGISYIHLGAWNLVVAVVIATAKASLVVLYFMHMKYEAKFNALVFIGSLLFLGIFLAYTLNDIQYRGTGDPQYGAKIDPTTGEWAHGTPQALIDQAEAAKEREAAAAAEKGGSTEQGAAAAEGEGGAAEGEGAAAEGEGAAAEGENAGGEGAPAEGAPAEGAAAEPQPAPAEGAAAPAEAPAKQPAKQPAKAGEAQPAAGGGE